MCSSQRRGGRCPVIQPPRDMRPDGGDPGKQRAIVAIARRLIGRIRACFRHGTLYAVGMLARHPSTATLDMVSVETGALVRP